MGLCQCPQGSDAELPQVVPKIVASALLVWSFFSGLLLLSREARLGIAAGLRSIADFLKGEAIEQQIAAISQVKRLELWTAIIDFFIGLMTPGALAVGSVLVYLEFFPNKIVYTATYLNCLLFVLVGGFFFFFRSLWTIRAADFYFYFLYFLFSYLPALATDVHGFDFAVSWCRLGHLLMAIVGPSLWQFVPLNLLQLGWELYMILSTPALNPARSQHIFLAVVSASYTISIRFASIVVFRGMAKALIKAVRAAHAEAIVRALLTVMCDSLVVLKEDLTLLEDSPTLAALLLGNPNVTGCAGQFFPSLLSGADALRFEDFVAEKPLEEHGARQVGLVLRDSTGNHVRVQMYHLCLTDPIDSSLTHFLGILEEKESGELVAPINNGEGDQNPEPTIFANVRRHAPNLRGTPAAAAHQRSSFSSEGGPLAVIPSQPSSSLSHYQLQSSSKSPSQGQRLDLKHLEGTWAGPGDQRLSITGQRVKHTFTAPLVETEERMTLGGYELKLELPARALLFQKGSATGAEFRLLQEPEEGGSSSLHVPECRRGALDGTWQCATSTDHFVLQGGVLTMELHLPLAADGFGQYLLSGEELILDTVDKILWWRPCLNKFELFKRTEVSMLDRLLANPEPSLRPDGGNGDDPLIITLEPGRCPGSGQPALPPPSVAEGIQRMILRDIGHQPGGVPLAQSAVQQPSRSSRPEPSPTS